MLDQLRSDLTSRLDELLGEADKLRRALTALGTRQHNRTSSATPTSSPSKPRTDRVKSNTAAPVRKVTPSSAETATKTAAPAARRSRSTKPKGAQQTSSRTAPGATKSAVLATLATGETMTAGQVATAAGLGRPTVSTTLSRLAKTGEVTKASRGYRITKPANSASAQDAGTTTAK